VDRNTVRAASVAVTLILALGAFLARSCVHSPEATDAPSNASAADSSVHLTMGNPSGATDDGKDPNNYLMRKPYFALSYNDAKGTPNWVSWCLKPGDFRPAPRNDAFHPDESLPRGFRKVRPSDFAGSGFDRGHMCPNGDRMGDAAAAEATFVMTNMIPQSPNCNQKAWADLEEYCRDLVSKKKQTLYIVAGPQGKGGTGLKGEAETIGGGRVTVPAKCWKVVLVVDNGTGTADDVSKVGSGTRVIAVVMPNDQSVTHGWAKYRTSAREVEKLTGYKFFDRVPAAVIDPLKEKVDDERIPPPRRKD
jgi:endonuclease G